MSERDQVTKERILAAALAILVEEDDPDRITVRQITERAGVAVSAINYHFQSKENLLYTAVGQLINDVAAPWYQTVSHTDMDPVTRLKRLVRESFPVVTRYRKLATMALTQGLLRGDLTAHTLVIPLVRDFLGPGVSELQLRLTAYQLITTLQTAFIQADAFRRFAGVNLFDEAQRDAVIDLLVDNVMKK
ncbi:MAG TPA: TetR/AcrR family transcriptional regulator [Symbiobacteriaceae bacterium]|nr:TetR/AcrR family transcriptional regulator [Symbiobacteriaceae bacterium]